MSHSMVLVWRKLDCDEGQRAHGGGNTILTLGHLGHHLIVAKDTGLIADCVSYASAAKFAEGRGVTASRDSRDLAPSAGIQAGLK